MGDMAGLQETEHQNRGREVVVAGFGASFLVAFVLWLGRDATAVVPVVQAAAWRCWPQPNLSMLARLGN